LILSQLPLVVPVLGNFQLKYLIMHLKVSTQILKITLLLVTDAVGAIGAIRCRQDFVLIMQYERAHKSVFYIMCWLVGASSGCLKHSGHCWGAPVLLSTRAKNFIFDMCQF
jgi:hypothetical protein